MTDLIMNSRPSKEDDFYISLQYDSRNYSLPFPFDGYQIFLNNDQNPFIRLSINENKIWQEKIDFRKFLGPGTYKIRVRTFVWTARGNNTSGAYLLKVGEFIDVRVYPKPSPPDGPSLFPEWKKYEKYQEHIAKNLPFEEIWDEWTVDYGV